MNPLRRVRLWWRRKRRGYLGKAGLREFVYLDDVSVYSLLASRSGPVATEFTQTESLAMRDEVHSGVTVSTPPLKSRLGSGMESTRTSGSQVVRQTSGQARFRQLLDDEQAVMLLRGEPRGKRPNVRGLDDLLAAAEKVKHRDWVLDGSQLRRGELMECEVTLATEPIYAVSQTMSSLLEVIQEDPRAFGLDGDAGLREGALMTRVLDAMLVGLVPIRARVATHRVLRHNGRTLLVRGELLQALGPDELVSASVTDFDVVGVTETGLFWKDQRRILFSDNRYQALFRLGQDGLREDWNAIKLADVLRDVVPPVADSLDSAGRGLVAAIRQGSTPSHEGAGRTAQMNDALVIFAGHLAGEGSASMRAELERRGLLLAPHESFVDTVEGRRALFAPVERWVQERLGEPVGAQQAALARGEATLEALYSGGPAGPPPQDDPKPDAEVSVPCLDSEIIAIYW